MYQVHQQHDNTTSLRKVPAAPQPHVSGAQARNVQVYPVRTANSDRPSTSSSTTSSSSSSFNYQSQQQQYPVVASVTPRSTTLPRYMGTSQSKPTPPLPPPSPPIISSTTTVATNAAVKGINAAVAGGIKLKRAFAGRRKKSEDATTALSKGKEPEFMRAPVTVPENVNTAGSPRNFQSRRGNASPPPPTPPEKDSITNAQNLPLPSMPVAQNRSSVMTMSPTISSAVKYMIADALKQESDKSDKVEKESWRKSDSNNSHHTIRAGAAARSSRPASWAESFQSGNTVVQVKRISLMADAEFVMAEEEFDDSDDIVVNSTASQATATTPTASTHKTPSQTKRRSVSLSTGVAGNVKASITASPYHPHSGPSATDLKQPSLSISEGVPPPNTPQPSHRVPRGLAPPATYPAQPAMNDHSSRRAAWAAASVNPAIISTPSSSSTSLDPRYNREATATPNQRMRTASPLLAPSVADSGNTSFRQTTISVTASGIAAAGYAKRAVEKMGKKWAIGMGITTSSSGSGYATSGSGNTAPTSFASGFDYSLARTSSNQSQPNIFPHRRTPGGSGVGTTSVSSSISGSDSDPFSVTAPHLGLQLRGSMRMRQGVATGVVFGRDLVSVVRDTAIGVGRNPGSSRGLPKEGLIAELERRALPALVVRCAQHLLMWGIKEEGLFRLSGRPSHTSRLRAEFDSGADYDMIECTPGDLDPHAVSSVFKAYLRELPETVLTQKLLPSFEKALNTEAAHNTPQPPVSPTRLSLRPGAGLPTGPKSVGAIRKPPSLSTLAMPSFQSIPPPSRSFINTVRSLVEQLPLENRDLLRTIVDLIKATARECKETKMPLSNLLVVFCPSLAMTPPLLKVFCEAEGIWGAQLEESPVLDIRRQTVMNIASPSANREDQDDEFSDASTELEEEQSLSSSRRPSEDLRSSDYHASVEDVSSFRRRRWVDHERPDVPTVYLDTQSHISRDSASSLPLDSSAADLDIPAIHHRRDPADNGSISSENYSVNNVPLLSSSAESVATPTSSGAPSFSNLAANSAGQEKHDLHTTLLAPRIANPIPLDLERVAQQGRHATGPSPKHHFPLANPPSPSKRRSIPILSLSGFSSSNNNDTTPDTPKSSSSGPAEGMGLRAKKPSLKLLFKKSNSSLKSGLALSQISAPILQRPGTPSSSYRQSPQSASDSSSISTPDSAVTAPQSGVPGMRSSSHLPSLLDMPIDDSSLSLDLGFDISPPASATHPSKVLTVRTVITNDAGDESDHSAPAKTPLASTSPNQPISSPTSPYRTVIKPGENHLRIRQPSVSAHPVAASHQLSMFEDCDQGEDWTQSVLLAADVNGHWTIQKPVS